MGFDSTLANEQTNGDSRLDEYRGTAGDLLLLNPHDLHFHPKHAHEYSAHREWGKLCGLAIFPCYRPVPEANTPHRHLPYNY